MNLRCRIAFFAGLFGFLSLFVPNVVKADSFAWTYQATDNNIGTGILDSGSGELTTANGVITGISGMFNGLAIASLVPPGGLFGNDNLLLLPAAPLYVTPNGFSFLDSAGTQFNIYAALGTTCIGSSCVPYDVYASIGSNQISNDLGNFTLTRVVATPEPSLVAMLLPAVLGSGLLLGRKRRA